MITTPVPATGITPAPNQGPVAGPASTDLWLILSGDDEAAAIPQHARGSEILVVSDPRVFERHLLELLPRLVVCAEPPADRGTMGLVVAERRRRPHLRAVHLAPPEAVASRLASLEAGFDDALASTVSARELAGRLGWLDGRPRTGRTTTELLAVTPDLVLDRDAHALWRNGRAVHLRPKEYALLSLLVEHPGRAFSRGELLAIVWGPDRSADTRTVDVHVRWLRSKIEPDPDRAVHLVTVRGTGYRFDAPR